MDVMKEAVPERVFVFSPAYQRISVRAPNYLKLCARLLCGFSLQLLLVLHSLGLSEAPVIAQIAPFTSDR